MAFRRTQKLLAGLAVAAAAITFQAAPSAAQVYYGGYNLGPDYGAMVRQYQQQMQRDGAQMQAHEQQIIAQVMQNPNFGPMYQQHRAQGGQMSPQQFAYAMAATRWNSPEGRAYFQQRERQNQIREQQALRGLREAEAARGAAQMGHMESFHRNNQEFGRTLRGNSTYVGPNGQNYVLPHTQPGVVQRDHSGNAFVMDNRGQYYMYTPYGWQPMQPGR